MPFRNPFAGLRKASLGNPKEMGEIAVYFAILRSSRYGANQFGAIGPNSGSFLIATAFLGLVFTNFLTIALASRVLQELRALGSQPAGLVGQVPIGHFH